ncbi:hypothetical protein Tco_1065235 [Tanacetum coccineum]
MTTLKFVDTHNMVAFLSKPAESDGFKQFVDFLNAQPIRYALTVNPTIYISCIEQLWSSGVVKTINGEVQLHALVDGKKIIISEASARRDLKLEDEEGIDCLPNSTIFEQLALMGYEKISQKLTFYKPFFSLQWKFLIHTILQCLSSKTTVWNEFRSTMASALICLATNQKFSFSKFIFEDEAVYKELGDSLVRAATTTSSLEAEQDSGNITKTRSKVTPNEYSFLGTTSGGGPRVLDLEKTKTTQQNEIDSLKRRVKKLEKKSRSRTHKLKRLYKVGLTSRVESSGDEEDLGEDASKQGRRINVIDTDEDITLVNVQDDADNEMFDVNILNGEEVFVAGQNENVVEEVVDAVQVSTAATTVTITTEEITLAQALKALKTSKPKVKGIVFQETGKSMTTTISSQQSQDKGKGIMIKEPVKPMKKKDLINLDEEVALKEWDDIQTKIEADHELAQRLQAEEQEELSVEEKAKLFQQLLEQRRNHFAAKKSTKKQKVDDDKDTAELQSLMEVIPNEEEVAIDVVPLATNSLKIVD